MNKQCRKALAVLSAVILTATSLTLGAKQNPNNLTYAKTLKEIEQEKKDKQDQIDKKKAELKKLAEDLSDKSAYEQTLKEEINLINGKMVLIDSQMSNLIGEISDKESEIADLQNQIDEEEVAVQEGLKAFKSRIRALYVHGNDSLLSALVGASSFYDVLARVDLIKRISKHDDEMITNLREEIQTLTNHKQDLTASVQALNIKQTEIQVLLDEFDASKLELNTALSDNNVEIQMIENKQLTANSELKQQQMDLDEIEKEQEEIIAEALRKSMEEERKQKEEEARKKAELQAKLTTTVTTTTTVRTTTTTTAKPIVYTTVVPTPAVTAPAETAVQHVAPQPVVTEAPAPVVTAAPTTAPTAPPTAPPTTAATTTTAAPAPSGSMFAWPVPGHYGISSYFGPRPDPFGSGVIKGHGAIDIIGNVSPINGAAVCAAGNGTVSYVTSDNWGGGYGKHVVIYHGNGYSTLYAHMQRVDVSVGQQVTVGQQVGIVGMTGSATGPHLHFEVRINNERVNPLNYLP